MTTDAPLSPPVDPNVSMTPPVQDDAVTTLPDAPTPAPTLADAVEGEQESEEQTVERSGKTLKLSNRQIHGFVAGLSARTLPADVRKSYVEDFMGDADVMDALDAVDMAGALAEYGLTFNGGKLPPWMALIAGTAVLGFAVYSKRGKYVQDVELAPRPQQDPAGGRVDGGGAGTPGTALEFSVSPAAEFAGLSEPVTVGG